VFPRLVLVSLFALACTRVAAADVLVTLTDSNDGKPIVDAVVSLVPLDEPAKISPPAVPVEIVQKGQQFIPYVTAVVVGTEIAFPNRDSVQHTIYSQSKPKPFTFALYDPGRAEKLVFDQPGVVAMGCNIHNWMVGFVVVLETPWFATTAAAGSATVAGVPAGNYRLDVWQPRLSKTHTQTLTVNEGSNPPVTLKLTLGRDQRIRRRIETGTGGYK
jgi:plastocyanin